MPDLYSACSASANCTGKYLSRGGSARVVDRNTSSSARARVHMPYFGLSTGPGCRFVQQYPRLVTEEGTGTFSGATQAVP